MTWIQSRSGSVSCAGGTSPTGGTGPVQLLSHKNNNVSAAFSSIRRFFEKLSAEVELKGVMEAKGEGILSEK